MADSSKEIGAGRVSFLTGEQKQRIYDAALGILGDIGMVVLHEEGEQVMLDGGCTRDADGLVHVPAALVEQARETRAGELPGLRPRRRAGHGPRRLPLLLRQRLRRHAPARPGDRRAPPRQDRGRGRGGPPLRRAARDRLRHVGRVAGRHGRRRGLPQAVPRHDRGHHQAAGHDGRRRRDGGAHVADGLRGPRRRAGAPRQAVLRHVQPAGQPAQAPVRDGRQAALLRRQGRPVHVLPVAGRRRHRAHHHAPARSRWASPRRCSAWSCTSSAPPARRSSSARDPTRSTWRPRSRPTTPPSSSARMRWKSRWPSGWTSPTGGSAAIPTPRSSTHRPAWRPTRSRSCPCSWAPTSTTTSATWTSGSPAHSPRWCWWPSSSAATGSCSRRSRWTTRRWPWTCCGPSVPAATTSASATRASTCARTSGAPRS